MICDRGRGCRSLTSPALGPRMQGSGVLFLSPLGTQPCPGLSRLSEAGPSAWTLCSDGQLLMSQSGKQQGGCPRQTLGHPRPQNYLAWSDLCLTQGWGLGMQFSWTQSLSLNFLSSLSVLFTFWRECSFVPLCSPHPSQRPLVLPGSGLLCGTDFLCCPEMQAQSGSLNDTNLSSDSSAGQRSAGSLSGLKPRCRPAGGPAGGSRGESVSCSLGQVVQFCSLGLEDCSPLLADCQPGPPSAPSPARGLLHLGASHRVDTSHGPPLTILWTLNCSYLLIFFNCAKILIKFSILTIFFSF